MLCFLLPRLNQKTPFPHLTDVIDDGGDTKTKQHLTYPFKVV